MPVKGNFNDFNKTPILNTIQIAAFFNKKGIDSSRLISKGYGETQLLVDCKSSYNQEDFQKNRRIEFIIIE